MRDEHRDTRVDFLDNLIGPGLEYGCLFGEGKSGSDALRKYAKQWSFVGNGCWDSHPVRRHSRPGIASSPRKPM